MPSIVPISCCHIANCSERAMPLLSSRATTGPCTVRQILTVVLKRSGAAGIPLAERRKLIVSLRQLMSFHTPLWKYWSALQVPAVCCSGLQVVSMNESIVLLYPLDGPQAITLL